MMSVHLRSTFRFFSSSFVNNLISIDADNFGETKTVDLIPNGRNIPVTETNKK